MIKMKPNMLKGLNDFVKPSSAQPYLNLEENHNFYHVGLLPKRRNKTEEIFQKLHHLQILCMYHI